MNIHSLPYMAGTFLISSINNEIICYNEAIAKNLFGNGHIDGKSVSHILPNFIDLLNLAKKYIPRLNHQSGIVLPEHYFRKLDAWRIGKSDEERELLFLNSIGIDALHDDGNSFKVDVQLRVLEADMFALWITYSRTYTNIKKDGVSNSHPTGNSTTNDSKNTLVADATAAIAAVNGTIEESKKRKPDRTEDEELKTNKTIVGGSSSNSKEVSNGAANTKTLEDECSTIDSAGAVDEDTDDEKYQNQLIQDMKVVDENDNLPSQLNLLKENESELVSVGGSSDAHLSRSSSLNIPIQANSPPASSRDSGNNSSSSSIRTPLHAKTSSFELNKSGDQLQKQKLTNIDSTPGSTGSTVNTGKKIRHPTTTTTTTATTTSDSLTTCNSTNSTSFSDVSSVNKPSDDTNVSSDVDTYAVSNSQPGSQSTSTTSNNNNQGLDYFNIPTILSTSELLSIEENQLKTIKECSPLWPRKVGLLRREKTFDQFNVIKSMGQGAYGKVSLCVHKEDANYKVVIKAIFKERILVDTWVRDRNLELLISLKMKIAIT
ncbi:unnamed protein product [[Candida] boidinii]|nr:unnamed protein product [[Candida] boidinii]